MSDSERRERYAEVLHVELTKAREGTHDEWVAAIADAVMAVANTERWDLKVENVQLQERLGDTEERATDAIDRLMTGVRELAEENARLNEDLDDATLFTVSSDDGFAEVYPASRPTGESFEMVYFVRRDGDTEPAEEMHDRRAALVRARQIVKGELSRDEG